MRSNQEQKEFDNLKNEIARQKKIIDWYQATYEHRSIFGIIKSKILAKKRNLIFFTKIRLKFENLFKAKVENIFRKRKTELAAVKNISKLKKQTFCAIANHGNNENAKRLLNTFSSYLTTQIIDCSPAIKANELKNLREIYYSELYNHAYEYAKTNNYKYLLFISSDVIVNEQEAQKMFQNLSLIELEDIGVYAPAFTGKSHHQCKKKNESGFRIVSFVERAMFLANMNVLENFAPVDTKLNLYGWGIDVAKGFYSKKMGLLNIIDDGVVVHQSNDVDYSVYDETQMIYWFKTLNYGNEIIDFHESSVCLAQVELKDEMKISIIIPCYNQVSFLKECIYSIFSQTYSNYEILIINDGSTDSTEYVARSLEIMFNQVRYIEQTNKGLGAARNIGLDNTRGNYIQFLDADDFLSRNKFCTAIQAFINNPGLDITYSQYSCFEDGNRENKWTYSRVELRDPPVLDLISEWEKELSIPIHCFLYKKEIINASRFDVSLPNHEDWEFHLTIASKRPTYFFIPNATAHYRMKKIAMSQNKELMKDGKNRCIANIISSQKIQPEHLPALYERFDYKIAVGIISCKQNSEKINASRNTWLRDLEKYQIPYYIVIGDPAISACKQENDILYVPCADNYENLPQKVLEFYQFIYEKTNYDFVYKMDDDCFLNIENLFSTYFWNYNYFGRTVATKKEELNKNWHFGKCSDPILDKTQYDRPYLGTWCGGGYGYFLSRKALQNIRSMADYIKADLYEDKAIGDALRKKNVLPEENSRYRILDITQFNINYNDETEFKVFIDHLGYSMLEYEIIIELQKEFQFRIIQDKKREQLRG